ncbi:BglG family transcription antiterminator [Herbiconiux sp. CPCC 203407]|uniref:BglG family transcription antiterminator n=1 Tax=Herbiconiux oxytropis TaxID=2970915 RepID=A0AA42BVS3_9MICO|nr:BglG family transcription antiterminator [Herbiconiux oxytropis]MCS5721201.1 BglG family transcription antiterminator [Herbiconiux oxytropis]MCS5724853.1 BglG family transcription antiterminator [Herbiconiux oxytropis]
MRAKYERLLDYLAAADDWVTAGELADRLGVTTRSVRSYVTSVKTAAKPLEVIASSTSGYRLNRDAYATFMAARRSRETDTGSPRERVHFIIRALGDAPAGLDIYDLAANLFVSESTVEADLRKAKLLVDDAGLSLVRRGSTVSLAGSELNRRRLLSRVFRDESAQGFLDLENIQREFSSENLSGFKSDLIAMLDGNGYFVNEYSIDNVLLHIVIAVDRVGKNLSIEPAEGPKASETIREVAGHLDELIRSHFDAALGVRELSYLSVLLTTRVLTPGHNEPTEFVAETYLGAEDLAEMRRIVRLASDEYLVDLDDEDFTVRLGLHIRNLVARAQENSFSRNPMTRSIKGSYPMIYELAVFIASQIQRGYDITVNEDEIAYIALHVGSYLERRNLRQERVSCAIVSPNYYEMHLALRERLEAALGSELEVEVVITRADVDWNALSSDIVVTTIPVQAARENVVVVPPFLTEADIEAVRRGVTAVRRHRRRMRLKDELLQYFDERLFWRNLAADSEAEMIRTLGRAMVGLRVIDDSYVEGAIERERMSSTAFTDTIAVPHAMVMSASRTAISIVVNETPMPWGENRVNVIALIAFSESGRRGFQTVFDQLVEVFSDRDDLQRIVRRSNDFASFIDELVHVMEA